MIDLYHGSEQIVEKPLYGGGKLHNDYGRGFYCTREPDLAREWSVDKSRDGYVNHYQLNPEGMKILDLSAESCHMLNWLAILLENRSFTARSPLAREAKQYILEHFKPDYKGADVIIGYRADDSYFTFAQDFLNNAISYRQLSEAMRLGKLGMQYMLQSENAFSQLHYVNAEVVESKIWYPRKELRDRKARDRYSDMARAGWRRGDLYVLNILEEGIGNDDPRLR